MANLAAGLERIVKIVGKAVNQAKKAIDKILWGNVNDAPAIPVSGIAPPEPKRTKVGSFIQSGLFNVIDVLLKVDLCNVLEYLTTSLSDVKPKRKENPTKIEKALYDLQDRAALVRNAIDSFYAFPNEVLTQLKDPNPQAAPAPGTTPTTNTPSNAELVGSNMQKYNFGIIGKYTSDIFKFTSNAQTAATGTTAVINDFAASALSDPEVSAALSILPGFKTSIASIKDYVSIIDQYADFRQIPNDEFQKLLRKLDEVRAVCVAIESLNLASAIDLADKYLGSDVRSQIAELGKFMDPTKIVPTLKQINNSLQSFTKTCQTITSNLRIARGFIKIGIVLVKIFRFIAKLIGSIPAPLQFATYSMVDKIRDAKDAVTTNVSGLEKFLTQVNNLLAVIINVIRYIQQNTQALIQRMDILIQKLEACGALKGSPVVQQLQQSQQSLKTLNDELAGIIREYDKKANVNNTDYGNYTIKVVEEELVDDGITNKRRRGIAIDKDNAIAAQSDLTFATNNAIIIEEVKFKLVALGLVSAASLSPTDLVIAESMTYLEDNDLVLDDLNLPTSTLESPDSQNQNSGLGLNGYLNQMKGTQALRKRVRSKLNSTSKAAKQKIAADMANTSKFLGVIKKQP